MATRIILGVQITDRASKVPDVQKVLTQYGCNIKTRLGLHDVNDNSCSTGGLLILETYGSDAQIAEMEKSLRSVQGVVVEKMVFTA